MSEHQPESKKNPIINYFVESYEELKKVTWPTRNQAIKLTFIVIGFCIVFSLLIGVLDFGFNLGYRMLVDYSTRVAPPSPVTQTPITTPVASGEPTSKIDLSKIKIEPSSAPDAAATTVTLGSSQQK